MLASIQRNTLALYAFSAVAAASSSVTVDAGTILGGECANGQHAIYYKGIPYAEPPVKDLRFQPPKAYGKYPGGKLVAIDPAPACIQFGEEFKAQGKASEDCLYLDIWTPSNATKDSKLPVKVFVYGGSNTDGGIGDSLYDGCNTADSGAILVSLNYRLGPLGFLALNSAGIYGNQAIQDLLLGLEWIQNSITVFGGDPKKVLLFGQSAGATDVFTIATLPQAPSLIKSAIAESIAQPALISNSTLQQTSASYAQSLNCDVGDRNCLQSKTVEDLMSAFFSDAFLHVGIGSSGGITVPSMNSHKFWPYVDGAVISDNPATRGVQVPTIFGSTQNEGIMDTLAKYNTTEAAKSATPAAYTKFLSDNFGPAAAQTIEKYYPLSLFNDTLSPVIAAIATVATDAEFKCPGYRSAVTAAQNKVPTWVYEFSHNSTCAWLDTIPQAGVAIFGGAHTAELPFVFGNLQFDFPAENTTCTGTSSEWELSRQMMNLWTAMAEKGNPSTKETDWPAFNITADGADTPGMIFGNSSMAGAIDFSACELWAKIDEVLESSNETPSATAPGAVKPTMRPTGSAMAISPMAFTTLSVLLVGVAFLI